jgi:hypothetical protein
MMENMLNVCALFLGNTHLILESGDENEILVLNDKW